MTKKLEIVDKDTVNILEHVADVMKIETYPQNTLVDFKTKDIVKCSILLGLYKVCFVSKTHVLISRIDGKSSLYPIHPKYLKKVEINRNTVDILYNGSTKDG